jgi:hypothetical protein
MVTKATDTLQSHATLEVWPPDDTQESVVGTDLHQQTIINIRLGINEIARLLASPSGPVPWQALTQTIITGFTRPDGSRYKTLPDVFVYRRPISQRRRSVALGVDGAPSLIVEVLSESTYEVDLDLAGGKGYSYAHAGVREYLTLDPTGEFLPEGVRAWRLEEGVYQPWEPDAQGRWRSAEIAVAIGLEGSQAAIYALEGRRQLREGEINEALAQREQELAELRLRLAQRENRHP